jgi:hypothetical protein
MAIMSSVIEQQLSDYFKGETVKPSGGVLLIFGGMIKD